MTKIYCESDLKIYIDFSELGGQPETPFELTYFTTISGNKVSCGWDGENYYNCKPHENGIMAKWDCPRFFPGVLNVKRRFYELDEDLNDGQYNYIIAEKTNNYICDEYAQCDETGQDRLYSIKGEKGDTPELPAWVGDTKPSYTAEEVGALPDTLPLKETQKYGDANQPKGEHIKICWDYNSAGENYPSTRGTILSVSSSYSGFQLGCSGWEGHSPLMFRSQDGGAAYSDWATVYSSLNLQEMQSMSLSSSMVSTMSYSAEPAPLEQPVYEDGELEQVADYWVYRYDTTENDGQFVANEVRIYGEPTKANITKAVMEAEFGKGYETNILNDYNEVQMGIVEDSGQNQRYYQFLKRRRSLKAQIAQDFDNCIS